MSETLTQKILAAAAFDELATEDAAINAGCAKIYAGKPGTHHIDNEYFDEGAKYENARLLSLLAALADVASAAEAVVNACADERWNINTADVDSCDDALARLHAVIGGRDGEA